MKLKIKTPDPSSDELNFTFVHGLCASESLFSRLNRWMNFHQVNASEMRRLLAAPSLDVHVIGPVREIDRSVPMPESSLDLSRHVINGGAHPEMRKKRHPLQKLGLVMGMNRSQFLLATGSNEPEPGVMLLTQIKQLRFCQSCLDLGFHSIYFQYPGATDCPYHGERLRNTCAFCKQPNSPTIGSIVASPSSCWNCGHHWGISNSEVRNGSLRASISAIGALIDSRMQCVKPISSATFNKFGSWLQPVQSGGPCFPKVEMAVQARRWSFWSNEPALCPGAHEQIVPFDKRLFDSESKVAHTNGIDCPIKLRHEGFWPTSEETVTKANDVLKWLSHECSLGLQACFRLRAEISMKPQGRCINSTINIVHVALHQTMLTYGSQRTDYPFPQCPVECEVDVYADIRWNHLQFSRLGPAESPANQHLIEAEILSWFAISLMRARRLKFSLEVAWPWYLNPWQFVPPSRTVRIGADWAVQYRSRACRNSVKKLISRYRNKSLSATHLQDLRQALQMAHISVNNSFK